MNPKEILEVVKTLNLNLNSATASEVVKTLSPYIVQYFFYQAIMTILGYITTALCVYFICRATTAYWKTHTK